MTFGEEMMKNGLGILGILILIVSLLPGCDIIPENFNIGVNADIDTTSELGPETLERVDAVNETLASGIEVGPDTLETIEELNETIANGLKAGFDEETLERVDDLLRVVEDGLKIGLDDETLSTIDGMVETIDDMPGNWEASAQDIIQTLENTAGSTAKKLADEVKGVMDEARINFQQMTAIAGVEFRCNVDFMGSKVGATAQEFIGKSIVGKLKSVLSGKKQDNTIPTPWVCQINPDRLELSKVGDRLVFESGVISLTGYNYVEANKPTAVIVDESGVPVPGVPLYPFLTSPYQIQLNLQDLDFSQVPPRSRIVFTWPNVAETSGVALLMPAHAAPIADFTSDKLSGNAPLTVQFSDLSTGDPVSWEWVFGDGTTSLEQNPSHTFLDSRDFQVQLTVANSQGQSTVIKIISVGQALASDFTFTKTSGDAPLLIQFKDKSSGGPTSWLWDFGDGESSTEQNPQHLYSRANINGYLVTLTVQNQSASSHKSATDRIRVYEKLDAQFSASRTSGSPPFDVAFTNSSLGGTSIASYIWDFGDGTPYSNEISPTHTYSTAGNFDVTLTVVRTDGVQDKEVKNALINSHRLLRLSPQRILINPIKQNSVYFTSFSNIVGGTLLDTKISAEKYLCAVNGMTASNGVIFIGHSNVDGPRVYLDDQPSPGVNYFTWWLMAEFIDYDSAHFAKETWKVNLICFDRSMENTIFTYNDTFRNMNGGDATPTGLSTDTYFNCGVAGLAGLAASGFWFNTIFPIPIENYLDGTGDEWVIHSDMDVANGGDRWNTNVLCLKRGAYMNVESPPFLTDSVFFQTTNSTFHATNIKTSDFICGVNGYKAEWGDIYTVHPLNLIDPRNIAPQVIAVNAFPKDGFWWVEANLANRVKNEDWTVNLLCARRGIAVEGTPPN